MSVPVCVCECARLCVRGRPAAGSGGGSSPRPAAGSGLTPSAPPCQGEAAGLPRRRSLPASPRHGHASAATSGDGRWWPWWWWWWWGGGGRDGRSRLSPPAELRASWPWALQLWGRSPTGTLQPPEPQPQTLQPQIAQLHAHSLRLRSNAQPRRHTAPNTTVTRCQTPQPYAQPRIPQPQAPQIHTRSPEYHSPK